MKSNQIEEEISCPLVGRDVKDIEEWNLFYNLMEYDKLHKASTPLLLEFISLIKI